MRDALALFPFCSMHHISRLMKITLGFLREADIDKRLLSTRRVSSGSNGCRWKTTTSVWVGQVVKPMLRQNWCMSLIKCCSPCDVQERSAASSACTNEEINRSDLSCPPAEGANEHADQQRNAEQSGTDQAAPPHPFGLHLSSSSIYQ